MPDSGHELILSSFYLTDFQRGVMTLLVVLGFTALAVIIWLVYAVL